MEPTNIESLIKNSMPDAEVTVTGDGRHFEAWVISAIFEGMTLLQRQRYIYGIVGEELRDGTIHALSIKAKTPLEWQTEKK